MKKIFLYTVIGCLMAVQIACQKVIEIDLAEGEREIVVEGELSNFDADSYILLSKTVASTEAQQKEIIAGGSVSVRDKDGIVYEFTETEPGRFEFPSFKTTPNNEYELTAMIDGKVLNAQTFSKTVPTLDSLTYLVQVGGFLGDSDDTTYFVFYNFNDIPDEENFYQIKVWVNGVADNNYYLTDDRLAGGGLISAPLFGTALEPKDSLYVELISMDEANYTFLNTLSLNLQQSAFAAAPANPVSNIENGIGYFGAYAKDSLSIVFP